MAAKTLLQNIVELGMTQGDLVKYLNNIQDIVNELQSDHATYKTVVDAIIATLQGNYIIGVPALAIGSTKPDCATALFHFMIGGKHYIKAAVVAGSGLGNDVIPQAKYGAVALEIGADGTIDAIEAAANAAGYATAALALAGIPAVSANHARVGTVSVIKSDGTFTFNTSDLDVANSTVVYTDATTLANAIADAAPATLSNATALKLTKG